MPVAFLGAVTDRTRGVLSLQVAEYVAAALVSTDDVAAVESPRVDHATAGGTDQPVGLVIGDRITASSQRVCVGLG